MRSTAVEPDQHEERPSRLAELLACEEELAKEMAEVRAEARCRVEAARAEADRAAAKLGRAVEVEGERARREIEESCRARVQALLEDARARVARFDSMSDEDVSRLVEHALRLLKEGDEAA